jgi:hypothetical protein
MCPFCQGKRGAVSRCRMPHSPGDDDAVATIAVANDVSRSPIQGKASVIWRAILSAVG